MKLVGSVHHTVEQLAVLIRQLVVKAAIGDKLTFLGGIDISHAMPGTREAVTAEARLRIAQLAHGGGYVLAPSNNLQADVPPENVVALFEAAQKFGSYPIRT